jgi:hypothetical protein
MKIIIYLGHPAQYHFFKNIVKELQPHHEIRLLIKSKDVLESLLISDGLEYVNILPEGRKSTKMGFIAGLLKREIRVYRECIRFKPNLMMGSDPSIAHVGKLLNVPVLTVLEDDAHVIPDLAKITFPYTSHIVAPDSCDCGKWNKKKISYAGYMKLAYLHPNRFTMDREEGPPMALIRLSGLDAFHDGGIKGFDEVLLKEIILMFNGKFEVKISSEKPIDASFDPYLLHIRPDEIHSLLSRTSILISDSQSMTMEAAMLGIPSIRYNDFVGRIGVLEELEDKYRLTYGVLPGNKDKIFRIIHELMEMSHLRNEFQKRRLLMLQDKIDVTSFMVWLVDHYPESISILQDNPGFQLKFGKNKSNGQQ